MTGSPRPARCVAPRPGSPRRFPGGARFRAMRPLLPSVVRPCPRATANMATVPCDASTAKCCACSSARGSSPFGDAVMQGLPPCHVAHGDELTPGTLAPRHHAGTSFLLTETLAAAGPNAAFAPRHYRTCRTGGNAPPRVWNFVRQPEVVTGRRIARNAAAPRHPRIRGVAAAGSASPRFVAGTTAAGCASRKAPSKHLHQPAGQANVHAARAAGHNPSVTADRHVADGRLKALEPVADRSPSMTPCRRSASLQATSASCLPSGTWWLCVTSRRT